MNDEKGSRRKGGEKEVENYVEFNLNDSGGRRSGLDRRRFSYSSHIPERRSGEDRRAGEDRREFVERRSGLERRSGKDRRVEVKVVAVERRSGQDRRSGKDRRRGADRRDFLIA